MTEKICRRQNCGSGSLRDNDKLSESVDPQLSDGPDRFAGGELLNTE